MTSSYGLRLNVCLRRNLGDHVFVRPSKYTISARVLPCRVLNGTGIDATAKTPGQRNPSCNQERSSAVRVFTYRRFLPCDVELQPRWKLP